MIEIKMKIIAFFWSLVGPPYTFRFRVKFYTSDPQNLHDELTRYLFVLQLKDDIRTGKLDCPSGSDIELAALSVQGKINERIIHL